MHATYLQKKSNGIKYILRILLQTPYHNNYTLFDSNNRYIILKELAHTGKSAP